MKKLIGGAIAAMMLAFAPAAQANWSGCYIGGNVGVGVADTGVSALGLSFDGISSSGYSISPEVGCNIQMGTLVFGVLGEYQFNDIETKLTGPGFSAGYKIEDMWVLAARAGITVTPDTLVYGKFGYTQAGTEGIQFNGNTILAIGDLNGWVLGGGIETKLTKQLSLDLKYDYTMFETKTLLAGLDTDTDLHQIRVGMKWNFYSSDRGATNLDLK